MRDPFEDISHGADLGERYYRNGGNGATAKPRFWLEPFHNIDLGDEPEWLIADVLPARGLAVLYGEPGCGKSFLAADLSLHIAQGKPWGGKSIQQGLVIHIAAEGANGFRKRMVAYRQHHGITETIPFLLMADVPDLGSRPGDAATMIMAIREQVGDEPIRLVTVDTVHRTMCGADENSAADMGVFIANCGQIACELDCCVLALHHAGKDTTRGARGSNALKAAADLEILVDGSEERRTATVTKSKDGEAGLSLAFTLDRVDIDGSDASSCVVEVLSDWAKPVSAARPYSPKLSAGNRIALRALQRAICDAGEVPPASNHIPPNVKAVTPELWRRYFYEMREGERKAREKAFRRAVDTLQADGFVGVWNDFVWIAQL